MRNDECRTEPRGTWLAAFLPITHRSPLRIAFLGGGVPLVIRLETRMDIVRTKARRQAQVSGENRSVETYSEVLFLLIKSLTRT